jgi:hypothetical protein
MDTQDTGIASYVRSSSTDEISRKTFLKFPYELESLQRTDPILELNERTDLRDMWSFKEPTMAVEGLPRESIRAWFFGRVTNVYPEDGYFEAHLVDPTKGTEMTAEFNIEEEYKERNLGPGIQFVFFVATKHTSGNPETISAIEFMPPHIWQEEDNEKVKDLYKSLFPNDPPLRD